MERHERPKIKKASRHLRYNVEVTPREDQSVECMRLHMVAVDNESVTRIFSNACHALSAYGMLDDENTLGYPVRGKVKNSDYHYHFKSFDIRFRSSLVEEAFKELDFPCLRDERLIEVRKRYKNQFRNEKTNRMLASKVKAYYEV